MEGLSILTLGLPPLQKHGSKSDGSSSKSHDKATCVVHAFGILSNEWKHKQSVLHARMSAMGSKKLSYGSEANIQVYIDEIMVDVIGATGCDIRPVHELSIFGNRVDIWLITKFGKPVGVIEIKKPGNNILQNPHVLGQLYDYMLRLRSFFGVNHVFGILTSYDEWRICWLPDKNTDTVATEGTEKIGATTPQPLLPVAEGSAVSSPSVSTEHKDRDRTMHGTSVIKYNDQLLVRALCSVVVKMSESSSSEVKLIDSERPYIVWEQKTWHWQKAPFNKNVCEADLFHSTIPEAKQLDHLIFLDDFGAGADGRAWRACTPHGNGCVVKFGEQVQLEHDRWVELYGKDSAVLHSFGEHTGLVMPYLRPVDFTNEDEVAAMKEAITALGKHWEHKDMHRRHIGFRSPDKERRAKQQFVVKAADVMVFDLAQLVPREDNVDAAANMLEALELPE
jgi:hypothetical protein